MNSAVNKYSQYCLTIVFGGGEVTGVSSGCPQCISAKPVMLPPVMVCFVIELYSSHDALAVICASLNRSCSPINDTAKVLPIAVKLLVKLPDGRSSTVFAHKSTSPTLNESMVPDPGVILGFQSVPVMSVAHVPVVVVPASNPPVRT